EVEGYRKAIEAQTGKKRRPRGGTAKYRAIAIRLHPQVIAWAKKEAKQRGIGYHTVINEALLARSAQRVGVGLLLRPLQRRASRTTDRARDFCARLRNRG